MSDPWSHRGGSILVSTNWLGVFVIYIGVMAMTTSVTQWQMMVNIFDDRWKPMIITITMTLTVINKNNKKTMISNDSENQWQPMTKEAMNHFMWVHYKYDLLHYCSSPWSRSVGVNDCRSTLLTKSLPCFRPSATVSVTSPKLSSSETPKFSDEIKGRLWPVVKDNGD